MLIYTTTRYSCRNEQVLGFDFSDLDQLWDEIHRGFLDGKLKNEPIYLSNFILTWTGTYQEVLNYLFIQQ